MNKIWGPIRLHGEQSIFQAYKINAITRDIENIQSSNVMNIPELEGLRDRKLR